MLRSLLLCTALLAGCYSEEPDAVYAGGGAAYGAAPGLVEVSPGVDVIADYDYPVFYSDGLYWRYDGGMWYQSGWYGGGWGVAYNVPYGVRGIHNPGGYAHYHGASAPGSIRDHRGGSYNGGGFARRGGSYNGGYRAAPVRSSPGQFRSAPAARSFGGGGARSGGGFRGGGGGGFHGGGGGHGGHR